MMSSAFFSISLVPVPSPNEKPQEYGKANVQWQNEIQRLCFDVTKELNVSLNPNFGSEFRFLPIGIWGRWDTPSVAHEKGAGFQPDWISEIVLAISSPAVAAGLYKILKAWIKAKAGREVMIKFGKWETRFKGLSEKQIERLFENLLRISERMKNLELDEAISMEKESMNQLIEKLDLTIEPLEQSQLQELKRKEQKDNDVNSSLEGK